MKYILILLFTASLYGEQLFKSGFAHGEVRFKLKQQCVVEIYENVSEDYKKRFKDLEETPISRTLFLQKGENVIKVNGYYIFLFTKETDNYECT